MAQAEANSNVLGLDFSLSMEIEEANRGTMKFDQKFLFTHKFRPFILDLEKVLKPTQFKIKGRLVPILGQIWSLLNEIDKNAKISNKTMKFTFTGSYADPASEQGES